MKQTMVKVMMAGLLMGLAHQVLANQAYYIDSNGRRIEAANITADAQGNLQIDLGGGATSRVNRGNYRYAYVPKPNRVAALEQWYSRGDIDRFLQNLDTVFNEFRYLGWGGLLYYWKGNVELRRNNHQQALDTFETARQHAIDREQRENISIGRVKSLLELERNAEAQELLQELKSAEGDHVAAFSFAANGRLLAAAGREDEAILELLKAVLLFQPESNEVREVREEAKQHLLAILERRGDPAIERVRQIP